MALASQQGGSKMLSDVKVALGEVKLEVVRGRTVATWVFAQYPLKLLLPTRVRLEDLLWF